MTDSPSSRRDCPDRALPELELSDEDILEAMGAIPGYVDISTEDFRILYHHAHRHAIGRLLTGIRADSLMRIGFTPLAPSLDLAAAAQSLVAQAHKSLPVGDEAGRLLGMFSETNLLRALRLPSLADLLLHILHGETAGCRLPPDATVGSVMTSPAVAVPRHAGFREIVAAFHRHPGRAMAVLETDGRIAGLLLRQEFLSACHLELPA